MWIGLAGHAVDDDLRALCKEVQPSGFVLFARNIAEPAQVLDLTRELRSLAHPHHPVLVSVDQEGGRVQRLREPATRWPPMRHVGQAGDLTAEVARAIARELRAVGIDLDFAPVADVDSNPANPVIGDRAFATTPEAVARHVDAFVTAMQAEGVVACAKHFPGHGDTRVDSHLDLPVVEEEDPRLRTRELVPFAAAVRAGVGTIMTAHVVYPAWDEELPATLSPHVIPRLLREELGYDGVVVSDDLEMKAVHGRWEASTQVQLATEASVDVLLCCKEPELQVAVFQALVRAQEAHAGLERASRDAAARVHRLRERFLRDRPRAPGLEILGCAAHRLLAAQVRERGEG
ncbi:MAG: beta-N-acetylhexosaminidase [Alphaproteobacteria bacterium]|nr:beta-N-acetylhexosaminidase [Alphaproteobacteria bacterium]